jgi:2-dehydropantoate 2-reductase
VAVGRGVNLPADIVATALSFIDGLPAEGLTSLQRDIADGRRSELEALAGAVVRLGREAGVETPINYFVYGSLLPQEEKARGGE